MNPQWCLKNMPWHIWNIPTAQNLPAKRSWLEPLMARGEPRPGACYLLLSTLPWASMEPEYPVASHLYVNTRPGGSHCFWYKHEGKVVLAGESMRPLSSSSLALDFSWASPVMKTSFSLQRALTSVVFVYLFIWNQKRFFLHILPDSSEPRET